MKYLVILLLYLAIAFVELPPLVHDQEYKQVFLYTAVFLGALTISLLLVAGVKIPSPAQPINQGIDMIKAVLGGG